MEKPVNAQVINFGIEGITITSPTRGERPGFLLQLTHEASPGKVSASNFQLSPQTLAALCDLGQLKLMELRAFLASPPANPLDTLDPD